MGYIWLKIQKDAYGWLLICALNHGFVSKKLPGQPSTSLKDELCKSVYSKIQELQGLESRDQRIICSEGGWGSEINWALSSSLQ